MSTDISQVVHELFDPVKQAERALRLEEYERTRTDPWRWYCRLCGATGEASTDVQRDADGFGHLGKCEYGCHPRIGTDASGRLRHVWSY